MKKLLVILFICVSAYSQAQNFQLHRDFERGQLTSTFEMFKMDKWGNTFTFIDFDYKGGDVSASYYEIARVIKTDKMPIGLHLEYNGGTSNMFSFRNAFLAGANYSKGTKDWGFSTYAAYKDFNGTSKGNVQLTATWYLNLLEGKITFSGFADVWTENGLSNNTVFISEPQLWYNATENISLGGELEISNNFATSTEFKLRPTLAVKWNF